MNYVILHCNDCCYVDLIKTDLKSKDVCPVCGDTIFDYRTGFLYKRNGIKERFQSDDDYWTVYDRLKNEYNFGFYKMEE